MSAIRGYTGSGSIATTTSAKTLLQLVAAANHRVKVMEYSIDFAGTNNTAAPVLVELVRQSTAGTSSAGTVTKLDESADETLQTTSIINCTAEPAGTVVVDSHLVHPQGGYTWQAPFGGEHLVKGGTRLGIRVTAAADVNAVAAMKFEE